MSSNRNSESCSLTLIPILLMLSFILTVFYVSENDESTESTVSRINYRVRTPCISQIPNVIVFFDWQPSKIICGVVSCVLSSMENEIRMMTV